MQAQSARDADFQLAESDRPLIAQFAASDPEDFAAAAQLISPYVDAVDLNCGCPQRWAIKEGNTSKFEEWFLLLSNMNLTLDARLSYTRVNYSLLRA